MHSIKTLPFSPRLVHRSGPRNADFKNADKNHISWSLSIIGVFEVQFFKTKISPK